MRSYFFVVFLFITFSLVTMCGCFFSDKANIGGDSPVELTFTPAPSAEEPEEVPTEISVEDTGSTSEESSPEVADEITDTAEIEETGEERPEVSPAEENIKKLRNGKPLKRAVDVPPEYKTDIPTLVSYLIEGIDDDFEKAKVLHDWIALNIAYDTESYFSGEHSASDGESVFESGKSVCGGYSSLYEEFCNLAGLKCVTISGLSKGYGFGTSGELGDHAWNALELDGRWYLVDSTWDAGYLEGKDFIWDYGTHYLFCDPVSFIYTHYPEEPRWQLINPPVTEDEFKKLAWVKGRFFTLGLGLSSPLTYEHTVDGEFDAVIKVPHDVLIISSLTKDGKKFEDYTLSHRKDGFYFLEARFPGEGKDYTFTVFAKKRGDEGDYYDVLEYKLGSTCSSSPFPQTYRNFTEQNCFLYSPLAKELKTDEEVYFSCYVEGAEEVVVVQGNDFIPLKKREDNIYEGTVKISGGNNCSINAKLPGKSNYWSLAEYTVR